MRLMLLLLPVALGFSGCAYKLGPTNGRAAGSHSIQVQPFVNKTIEPRLEDALTQALRKQLQQDGTFRLETAGPGDVIVSGHIVRFVRQHLSFQARDVLTPKDYRLVMTARITAQERVGGKVLLDRTVSGHSTIRVGSDLVSAERQAIPLLAEDLARNATALLVDGSW